MTAVDTLRVSVTDRCDLRCTYCVPPQGVSRIPARDVLRYEEILRVVRIGLEAGIRKVRITGGEPLARRGLIGFVRSVTAFDGVLDCCLTTNGVRLAGAALRLKDAGLDRVTVSLDSLRRTRYREITGYDGLERVLAGIASALAAGLHPVKVNVVLVPGLNEDEIVSFARLSLDRPLEVRFIERMPLGRRPAARGCGLQASRAVSGDAILRRIEGAFGRLEGAAHTTPIPGPARLYRIRAARGRVGVITPMSHPFCHSCGRLRLTPDGKLRNCLFRSAAVDLRGILRGGGSDAELRAAFRDAIRSKPPRRRPAFAEHGDWMVRIGG